MRIMLIAFALVAAYALSAAEPDTLAETARAQYEAGNYAAAAARFQQAVEKSPRNPQLHQWLGRSYGRLAETVDWLEAWTLAIKARTCFEQATSLAPNDPDILSDLMKFYAKAPTLVGGSMSKARQLASRMAALDPRQGLKARNWLAANAGS
ncbi:MAG: tetratricopeptide repeat protein [Gammaproteobacteria bacterium]|nr:tetratricopeptide repeat protein [Gammaproteobacteria bacterium]